MVRRWGLAEVGVDAVDGVGRGEDLRLAGERDEGALLEQAL